MVGTGVDVVAGVTAGVVDVAALWPAVGPPVLVAARRRRIGIDGIIVLEFIPCLRILLLEHLLILLINHISDQPARN